MDNGRSALAQILGLADLHGRPYDLPHQNLRYAAYFDCITGDAFAKAVADAGYATDPDYAAKLISIIDQHQLADLDGGA